MNRALHIIVILFSSLFLQAQFADPSKYIVDSLPYASLQAYDRNMVDSILSLYRAEKNDTVKMNYLVFLTENLEDQNAWLPYNSLMLKLSKEKLSESSTKGNLQKYYKRTLAGSYNNFGFAYNLAGKKDKALDYFVLSMYILEELQFKEGMSDVYNNIGLIYKNIGQTSKALDYYFKCLKICDELKDSKGKASSLNNIGMLYFELEEYDKALEHLRSSLSEWEKLNNKRGISSTLSNIGLVYEKSKDNQKALEYYTRALVWNEKTGDKEGTGTCLGNIGWIYLREKNFSKAQNFFERSLMYRQLIKDEAGIGYALFNLGTLYRYKNELALGKKYAYQALDIGNKLGYPDIIKRTSHLLYFLEKGSNNYKGALDMHELYITMRDSMNNEQTRKAGLKKQYQYEFDLKETEYKADQEKREIMHADELKRQRIIFIASLIGGFICLVFAVILYQRFKLIQKQKGIIEEQRTEISTAFAALHMKNKEVMDSIYYARRIQNALLTTDDYFSANFHYDHFIFFKPKDIVSGDFYWATKNDNRFYIAVCDSTGHGVPGAFMSLLNIGYMSEAINEKKIINPNEVLNYVRNRLIENVNKEGQKDGFDGILMMFEDNTPTITYAAANNKPFIIRDKEIIELEGDRMPVGIGERKDAFRSFQFTLQKNDLIYMITDGFGDQFGGPKGKKFKLKQFQQLIQSISVNALSSQKESVADAFEKWKAWPREDGSIQEVEQIDDVCVMGIKYL